MLADKRVLAVVPARGGSKRLPRKNVLSFHGRPLVAWSVRAALDCALIDKVLVSTDDPEVRDVALAEGAECPFLRPAALSSDTATTADVILHALDYYEQHGEVFDIVMVLQPTSPLRTAAHVEQALALFVEREAHGVVSVCECEHHPYWANTLGPDRSMADFIKPENRLRSQDMPPCYRLNGAIYAYSTVRFRESRTFFYDKNVYACEMPVAASVDIDTKTDFLIAETIAREEGAQ